jgi:hypothetical protein
VSFWLNRNRLFSLLQRISFRGYVIIAFATICFFVGTWLITFFFPAYKNYYKYQSANDELLKQIDALSNQLKEYDSVKTEKKQVQKKIEEIEHVYKSNKSDIEKIVMLLKKYNLTCKRIQREKYYKKKKYLLNNYVNFSAEGTFINSIKFFHKFCRSCSFAHVVSLNMKSFKQRRIAFDAKLRFVSLKKEEYEK